MNQDGNDDGKTDAQPGVPAQTEQSLGFAFVSFDRKPDGLTDINKAAPPTRPVSWNPAMGDSPLGGTAGETMRGAGDLIIRRPQPSEELYKAYRLSAILSPIISALITNVYQSPFDFPVADGLDIDDEEETKRRLREYLQYRGSGGDMEKEVTVSDSEVGKELTRLKTRVVNERLFLESWLKCCTLDITYLKLRILTGQDLEVEGHAYWEVLRDASGRPSRISWCPAWAMNVQPILGVMLPVSELQAVTPIHWEIGQQLRRFRTFLQVDTAGSVVAHYKEYGDKRIMSRRTGRYYESFEAMQAAPGEFGIYAQPATEIIQFQNPSSGSYTYGKTEWNGAYPNVEGSRNLEEMNMGIVVDQVIPQLMLLISGGRGVKKEDQARVEAQIMDNIEQGRRGLYILHAQPAASPTGRTTDVTMHLERLKSEQYQDALGLSYLKHSKDTVRGAFRMPKIALGDEEGTNRSTAVMLLRLVENQVYEPKREIIDDVINSTLLPDLGIQCTRYRTTGRAPKEPTELTEMVTKLMVAGVLSPEEGRGIAEGIFNTKFKNLKSLWTKMSPRILTAILQTKNQLIAAALLSEEGDLEDKLREALLEGSQAQGSQSGSTGMAEMQDGNQDASVQREESAGDGVEDEGESGG